MSSKNKLKHFADNLTYNNMFQPTYQELIEGYSMKGKWDSDFFKNGNPITLEVGCGKGEYTVGLGEKYVDTNFIGMDIKGARMWRGCTDSNEKGMKNIAFIRNHVQMVPNIFAENEIDELWITFPDPQPKKENKRLTSPRFLEYYRSILKSGAIINFKTDNEPLFDYTLESTGDTGVADPLGFSNVSLNAFANLILENTGTDEYDIQVTLTYSLMSSVLGDLANSSAFIEYSARPPRRGTNIITDDVLANTRSRLGNTLAYEFSKLPAGSEMSLQLDLDNHYQGKRL